MRETNHLRKLANESGKKMRGPKNKRIKLGHFDDPQCARCGYKRSSHSPLKADFEWSRKNGMCNEFVERAL